MRTCAPLVTLVFALAATAASAQVEFYGIAHGGLAYTDNGAVDGDAVSVESFKSRVGARGEERISGRTLRWQIEEQLDFDTGASSDGANNYGFKPRNTYLALAGGGGQLLIGKHDTPYKMATSKVDVFSDMLADFNAVVGSVQTGAGVDKTFDHRASNIVIYSSPEAHSLRAHAAYIADEDRDALSEAGQSLAVSLDAGPLYVSLAQEVLGARAPGGEDWTATALGLRYLWRETTQFGLVWDEIDLGTPGELRTGFYVNAARRVGNHTFKLAYGLLDALDGTPDTGADHFALGYTRYIAKNLEWYLIYTQTANDPAGRYGLDTVSSGAAGEDVTGFAAALKYSFSSL